MSQFFFVKTGTGGFVPPVLLDRISDLEFLSTKEFEGALFTDEGTTTSGGNFVSLRAGGAGLFLAGASISATSDGSGTQLIVVQLQVDGVPYETYRSQVPASANNTRDSTYHFEIKGIFIQSGKRVTLNVLTIGGNVTAKGSLIGWGELAIVEKLSDIEFMAIKKFDGKYFREISTEFNTTGVKISHVVPDGKTFYLAKAVLYPKDGGQVQGGLGTTVIDCKCEIKYDGTTIDVMNFDSTATSVSGLAPSANSTGYDTRATAIGESQDGTVAGETVEINITAVTGNFRVLLLGWEEDTGTSPRII